MFYLQEPKATDLGSDDAPESNYITLDSYEFNPPEWQSKEGEKE
jgi:hypothetical protein